jgi:phospholipid/cholesterol/gamma-HCH transport system substrate-binding protein
MRSFRERRPWLVGIASIVFISLGVGLAFSVNKFEGLRGVYSISADLKDAAGVQAGNEVRVAGVKVGRVIGVTLMPHAARVEMEVQQDIRLPSETRVEVKLKTLLGQKFIDLKLPQNFVVSASGGSDPSAQTSRFLRDGDVIPRSQTTLPFEIYQAANEGTEAIAGIDKKALRRMIVVFGDTLGTASGSLNKALKSLNDVGKVLEDKSPQISELLRNTKDASGVLAKGGKSLDGILTRSASVLKVLADRRATTSSLLSAVNGLSKNLGFLIQVARGSISAGTRDLNGILLVAESRLATIERILRRLGVAQKMFAQPLSFGRFTEGAVCALTTEDTCRPEGSPEDPQIPQHNAQPQPSTSPSLLGRP